MPVRWQTSAPAAEPRHAVRMPMARISEQISATVRK